MLKYYYILVAIALLPLQVHAQHLISPEGAASEAGPLTEIKCLWARPNVHLLQTNRLRLDRHAIFKPYLWEIWFGDYREEYQKGEALKLQTHTFESQIGRYKVHLPYYEPVMQSLSPVAFSNGNSETYRYFDKDDEMGWLLGKVLTPITVRIIDFDTLSLPEPFPLAKALKPLRGLKRSLSTKKPPAPLEHNKWSAALGLDETKLAFVDNELFLSQFRELLRLIKLKRIKVRNYRKAPDGFQHARLTAKLAVSVGVINDLLDEELYWMDEEDREKWYYKLLNRSKYPFIIAWDIYLQPQDKQMITVMTILPRLLEREFEKELEEIVEFNP